MLRCTCIQFYIAIHSVLATYNNCIYLHTTVPELKLGRLWYRRHEWIIIFCELTEFSIQLISTKCLFRTAPMLVYQQSGKVYDFVEFDCQAPFASARWALGHAVTFTFDPKQWCGHPCPKMHQWWKFGEIQSRTMLTRPKSAFAAYWTLARPWTLTFYPKAWRAPSLFQNALVLKVRWYFSRYCVIDND